MLLRRLIQPFMASSYRIGRHSAGRSINMTSQGSAAAVGGSSRPFTEARAPIPEPYDPPIQYVHLRDTVGTTEARKMAYTEEKGTRETTKRRPTIVCIHGAPGSVRDFRYIAPVLAKDMDCHVIRFDLPGHGSTPLETCVEVDDESIGKTIMEALEELGITNANRVVLLAHSLGGAQAFQLAGDYPDKVAGVVLINSLGLSLHRGIAPEFVKIHAPKVRVLSGTYLHRNMF
eukprot:gb/GECG01014287.1/.p1 GENE.gb/GECG01014287.1/~~gb/GECG01014287.1/.p1  ORF type:complete len:231 (+),score=12.68 gb/GECG01014287.1/:1-693(+)